MSVGQILKGKTGEIITVSSDQTIEDAVTFMVGHKIGAALVKDGADLTGIFTERDLMRLVAANGAVGMAMTVGDVMTTRLMTCEPSDSVESIMEMMTEGRFRHVPVLDDGKLVGIVSIGDLVKARMSDVEHEAEALRGYITAG